MSKTLSSYIIGMDNGIDEPGKPGYGCKVLELLDDVVTRTKSFIQMDDMNRLLDKILGMADPYLRYLFLAYLPHALVRRYSSQVVAAMLPNAVKKIAKVRAQCPNAHYLHEETDEIALQYLRSLQEDAYKRSMSTKATRSSRESFITASAPIIPYVGTITAPWTGLLEPHEPEENDEKEREAVMEAHYFKSNTIDACMESMHAIDKLFADPRNLALIWESISEIRSFLMREDGLTIYFARNLHHHYCVEITTLVIHLCICEHGPTGFESLASFMNQTKNLFDVDVKTAMEQLAPAVENLELTPEEITESTDSVLAGAAAISKIAPPKVGSDHKPLDLTYLMNYMYMRPGRWIPDAYTNTTFVKSANIASISYLDDYIVIEPKIGDEVAPFVYVPVVDCLQGRKVVVLKYWKDKYQIDILSHGAYLEEIADQTAKQIEREPASETPGEQLGSLDVIEET